jgi:hypothetical protein
MIISHRHKFIFLHNRKAAGSSITVALARYLGPEDIMLGCVEDCRAIGISPPRRMVIEALRYPNPKAALAHLPKGAFWKFVSASNKARYKKLIGPTPAHARAVDVQRVFRREWRDYSKFCVVRNPWTKTASDYFWRTKKLGNPPSFREYVTALVSGHSLGGIIPDGHDNWDTYTINDSVSVDRFIRFENLENDFQDLLSGLGLDWQGTLTTAKKNQKHKAGTEKIYRDMYSPDMIEQIRDLYKKEIDLFDYEFER